MTIKYHYDLIQGTPDWTNARIGVLTASCFSRILTPTLKIAENDDSRKFVYDILSQRISGIAEESYVNDDMIRGDLEEIEARKLYSANIEKVVECGIITNEELGFKIAYSPDGLVGDDGLIEIKSRKQSLHVKNILDDVAEKNTMMQIQSGLFISKRKWCDFISYCGGLPMFVKRVHIDEKYQEAIMQAAINFENRLQQLHAEYLQKSATLIKTERKNYEEII